MPTTPKKPASSVLVIATSLRILDMKEIATPEIPIELMSANTDCSSVATTPTAQQMQSYAAPMEPFVVSPNTRAYAEQVILDHLVNLSQDIPIVQLPEDNPLLQQIEREEQDKVLEETLLLRSKF